ncbi:arginine--tRNA ligase [Candidatus Kaiserbacteria bacterium]|nr:arginine--tRNA ligase [Candidatus Kaiserbacteria bacterium]
MDASKRITEALSQVLSQLGISYAKPALEFPAELAHGDFATNAALAYSKQLGKNPRALAEEIISAMGTIVGVSKIEIAGPGFINFHLASEYFDAGIKNILHDPDQWGRGNAYVGEEVMVEYTDPNPFKAFHIGHLMSNTIGESLARLIENAGAKVIRANYQGDVGVHVACAIWGMKKLGLNPASADEFGRAYAEGATAYKEDETAKKEIDDINKKIYDRSDPELNALYDTGRKASLDAFERIYATLGTKFDVYFFESETGPIGKKLVESYPEIFPESDGARVFKGEEYGLHTRVFINSQGLPTYEAKELGLEKLKMDRYPHATTLIVVTASEIIDYFKVVKKAMELVYPDIAAKLLHVAHGMLRLASGKMSSRTGHVITGESLLNDLTEAAKARTQESRADDVEKLARDIAVAAIKYQILRQGTEKNIMFDEARALSLEGDSGPYLQYTHARTQALLEKAAQAGVTPVASALGTDIERMLIRFPMVADRAAREFSPQLVTTYLTELASTFNAWYAREQIVDGTSDAPRKLAVVSAVATTLKNGLSLLGIVAPEKM